MSSDLDQFYHFFRLSEQYQDSSVLTGHLEEFISIHTLHYERVLKGDQASAKIRSVFLDATDTNSI